jgi:hypothetical protein
MFSSDYEMVAENLHITTGLGVVAAIVNVKLGTNAK